MREVVDSYVFSDIPLDVIWSDIDYMDKFQDFTLDENNFKDLPEFVKGIKENGVRWVPIIDAGIGSENDDDIYKEGLERDVYIKSPSDNLPLVGEVWPGDAVFPDFLSDETGNWWRKAL